MTCWREPGRRRRFRRYAGFVTRTLARPEVRAHLDFSRPVAIGLLELLERGLVPKHLWRSVTGQAAAGTPNIQWGAVGRKP